MNQDQNALIRYLMNEMDPSEVRLFEKELEENPNTRIDYEALKSTRDRVGVLPAFSAPQDVLENVSDAARRIAMARRSQIYQKRFIQAAAVVLVMVGSSFVLVTQSDILRNPTHLGSISSKEQKVKGESSPWVDRDQKIRFGGVVAGKSSSQSGQVGLIEAVPSNSRFNQGSSADRRASLGSDVTLGGLNLLSTRGFVSAGVQDVPVELAEYDSIYKESFEKLKLLQHLDSPQTAVTRELQLTGSRP